VTNPVIHKFGPLRKTTSVVDMPRGARVLSTHVQGGLIHVWAAVEPDQPHDPRKFHLIAAGADVPDTLGRLVGLAFYHDGSERVFHVFEDITTQVDVGPSVWK
jgi:hypothetical protein